MNDEKIVCKLCNGKGIIKNYVNVYYSPYDLSKSERILERTTFCPQCSGSGEVSWVDNILDRNKCELE